MFLQILRYPVVAGTALIYIVLFGVVAQDGDELHKLSKLSISEKLQLLGLIVVLMIIDLLRGELLV